MTSTLCAVVRLLSLTWIQGDAYRLENMPKLCRIHVLLREETFGLQATHDPYICTNTGVGGIKGERVGEGKGTGENERSRRCFVGNGVAIFHDRPING